MNFVEEITRRAQVQAEIHWKGSGPKSSPALPQTVVQACELAAKDLARALAQAIADELEKELTQQILGEKPPTRPREVP